MSPTLLLLLAYLAASISCMGAVTAWLIVSRRGDAGLKADVNELTLLVDRLAKTDRREKMQRVRAARYDAEKAGAEGFPVPPGAEALEVGAVMPFDKNELRRQIALKGVKR